MEDAVYSFLSESAVGLQSVEQAASNDEVKWIRVARREGDWHR